MVTGINEYVLIKVKIMNEIINRHIQVGNWIFEVKMVRALRVKNYGEPYSAIANISLNGNNAYVDGMMQKNLQQADNEDIADIKRYCQKLSIDSIEFDSNINHAHNNYSLELLIAQSRTQ